MQSASLLTRWATFYVIVGSSAAVLTGLMFVVLTVVTGVRARRPGEGIAAFSTPSVVHFCAALAVAAILSAPWHVLWHASLLLGLSGLGGLGYGAVVLRRVRRQAAYAPVLEDWSWHVVFPLVAYVALVVAAILLPARPETLLFVIGASTMLLLFIGIHNAWDNVTYLVIDYIRAPVENLGGGGRVDVPGGEHAVAGAPGGRGTPEAGDGPRETLAEPPEDGAPLPGASEPPAPRTSLVRAWVGRTPS